MTDNLSLPPPPRVRHGEQLKKLERKGELERELRSVESLVGRLKIVEAAKAHRAAATSTLVDEQEKSKDDDEEGEEEEEGERPPPSPRMCDVCGVKCVSPEAWDEHVRGRRHKKRLANVEAEAKVRV